MEGEITLDGQTYVPITTDLYNELYADLTRNQNARYVACESFRVYCAGEFGDQEITVAEGLKRCTPEQLQQSFYSYAGGYLWSSYIDELKWRLTRRETRRTAEHAAAATPITLGEEAAENEPDNG